MNPQYESRLSRYMDAVTLNNSDRVLVIPNGIHYYPTRVKGISDKEATFNHDARYQAWKEMVIQYNLDMAPGHGIIPGQWMEALGVNYYKWPGGELGDDVPFQFSEQEFLLADEYDSFLKNPSDFTARVIWPRKAKALAPFQQLSSLFWHGIDPMSLASPLSSPEFSSALEALQRLGQEFSAWQAVDTKYIDEMKKLGYPVLYQIGCHVPFDVIVNSFRGMQGVMLDMFRAPDKLLAAMDLFTQSIIDSTIVSAKAVGNPRVAIWLHWGAAGFMSDEQYAKFYWPSLSKVVNGLLDADLIPLTYFRGDYTPRLEYLTEFPKGRVPLQFDAVDRKKAREIIGGHQCFCSNIPGSLLALGTPEEVKADVRELIDLFADTGGLIIDGSNGIPDEAKPENVQAMVDAVHEYGVLG